MAREREDKEAQRRLERDPGEEQVAAERDADERTTEPTGGIEGPAIPGTVETGRPDREQIGVGDRADLDETIDQQKESPERDPLGEETGHSGFDAAHEAPSEESDQRLDRSEFTGQRGQTQARHGETETDTQGEQETRATLGMEPEASRTGRTSHIEDEPRRASGDMERARDHGEGRGRERSH